MTTAIGDTAGVTYLERQGVVRAQRLAKALRRLRLVAFTARDPLTDKRTEHGLGRDVDVWLCTRRGNGGVALQVSHAGDGANSCAWIEPDEVDALVARLGRLDAASVDRDAVWAVVDSLGPSPT